MWFSAHFCCCSLRWLKGYSMKSCSLCADVGPGLDFPVWCSLLVWDMAIMGKNWWGGAGSWDPFVHCASPRQAVRQPEPTEGELAPGCALMWRASSVSLSQQTADEADWEWRNTGYNSQHRRLVLVCSVLLWALGQTVNMVFVLWVSRHCWCCFCWDTGGGTGICQMGLEVIAFRLPFSWPVSTARCLTWNFFSSSIKWI